MSLVVAVDLPWGESGADRFAWAVVDAEKGLVVDLQWGMAEVQFLGYLDSLEQGCVGLVALDIPINGHEWMTREGQHFRPLDRALQSAGVPLYPSLRPGDRGARLASEVRRALRDPACPVYEVYPYANLCVLHAQAGEKGTPRAPWGVPLRYKKGPKEGRRRDLPRIRGLLYTELRFSDRDLPEGAAGDTLGTLDRVADAYDACLAAVPGLYWLRRSDRACVVGDDEHGRMRLLTNERIVHACEGFHIPVRTGGSQGVLP